MWGAGELNSCHVSPTLESLYGFQQLKKIDIVNRPGPVMVPIGWILPGDGHNVCHPQGLGCEQVRLQSKSVSVPAAELEDGL